MVDFLKNNWLVLVLGLIAFLEVIARLTPSNVDNTILEKLKMLLDLFFPNKKKSGGTFKSQ